MTISDHFELIPCKILMLCYDKDCKEFRYVCLDLMACWTKCCNYMSGVTIINILQVPKHGACSCGGFISSTSFSWGEDKTLDTLVFSFHPSSCEGIKLYLIPEEKVSVLTRCYGSWWIMKLFTRFCLFSGCKRSRKFIWPYEKKRRYSSWVSKLLTIAQNQSMEKWFAWFITVFFFFFFIIHRLLKHCSNKQLKAYMLQIC